MVRSKIRIGLIGYGNWGKRIYETLCSFPDVDVSIIEKNAFASHCDAVIIATPSSTHAELALNYLEKKIPTFVEKPLATSTRDVARIIDCVKANNSLLFIGYIYKYNIFVDYIKKYISNIGKIQSVDFFGYNMKPRLETSILWDWLPHDLFICKKIFSVLPNYKTANYKISNKKITKTEIHFSYGLSSVTSHLSSEDQDQRRIIIKGANGSVAFDDRQKSLEIAYDDTRLYYNANDYILPLTIEMEKFIERIQSSDHTIEKDRNDDLETSLEIANTIELIERSIRT